MKTTKMIIEALWDDKKIPGHMLRRAEAEIEAVENAMLQMARRYHTVAHSGIEKHFSTCREEICVHARELVEAE